MLKNTYIIGFGFFVILAIGFLFYKTFIYYKKQTLIKKIIEEWKGATNGGYIALDDEGEYKNDYYLSINNINNWNSHIHLMYNCHESALCYLIKKNDNHSRLYIIDMNNSAKKIVENMIQNYNHYEG